jgi:methionine-S-sulfoxide reductase
MSNKESSSTLYLGSGCFWSKEYHLGKLPGVLATRVGFSGGQLPSPTYQQVCTKTTGHAEVVALRYDETVLSTLDLLATFFSLHDPRIDRREKGGQYRSVIFHTTSAQKEAGQWWLKKLATMGHTVYTELKEAGPFWPAGERHQQYCTTKGLIPKPTKGLLSERYRLLTQEKQGE